MSIEEIKDLVGKLNREYNTLINNFSIEVDADRIILNTEDNYGIKNTSTLNIEKYTAEQINDWVKDIVDNIRVVQRLNKILEKHNGEFDIQYQYILNQFTIKNSIITDWSYNSIKIALSWNSLKLLKRNIETIEENTDKILKYSSLGEFISLYFENDFIGNLIEVDFEYDSVYSNIEAHQLSKEAILNKIKALENKSGVVHVSSTLASKALGLLCKIDWQIDFDNIELDIKFDENKIYSTRDKKFIRDSDILNGLLKLYKPNINNIFDSIEEVN